MRSLYTAAATALHARNVGCAAIAALPHLRVQATSKQRWHSSAPLPCATRCLRVVIAPVPWRSVLAGAGQRHGVLRVTSVLLVKMSIITKP